MGWLFGKKKVPAKALAEEFAGRVVAKTHPDILRGILEEYVEIGEENFDKVHMEWFMLHLFLVKKAFSAAVDDGDVCQAFYKNLDSFAFSAVPDGDSKNVIQVLCSSRAEKYDEIFKEGDATEIHEKMAKVLKEETMQIESDDLIDLLVSNFLEGLFATTEMLEGIQNDCTIVR